MHGHDDLLELVCLLLVGCSGATADPSIASQEAHNEQQGEDGRPLAARGSRSEGRQQVLGHVTHVHHVSFG